MALVKTSQLGAKATSAKATQGEPPALNVGKAATTRRSQDRTRLRRQKAAERIGAATEELATGVAEAASAAEELRRALEQIASGAEEAAGAAHESLSATTHLSERFSEARSEAEAARGRTEKLQTSVSNPPRRSSRQSRRSKQMPRGRPHLSRSSPSFNPRRKTLVRRPAPSPTSRTGRTCSLSMRL
ncbi:methyl-accepting chemotaxis sensory transducer domain protein (plasmid) [Sinorhizobium sp. RAC02]|nr:methyl-accepting chemotaxis sensory transducer domain protein [Sinorhizobium sp. RAC02]